MPRQLNLSWPALLTGVNIKNMKLQIHTSNHTYSLAIWVIGLAALLWSIWLSYQYIDRAILSPALVDVSNINTRQHKLNSAIYDKVMTAWNQKKDQAKIDTPLANPFTSRP